MKFIRKILPRIFFSASDFKKYREVIVKSELFDAKFYIENYLNEEVGSSRSFTKEDAIDHYLIKGVKAGYDPSNHFSTSWYLNRYEDVRESGMNPLIHFVLCGEQEGRLPRPPLLEQIEQLRLDDSQFNFTFYSTRTDGLGERLKSLLNAIVLADYFKCGFKFTWAKSSYLGSAHSIASPEDTFSEDFLQAYMVMDVPNNIVNIESEEDVGTLGSKNAAVRVSQANLVQQYPGLNSKLESGVFAQAFKTIQFSREINTAIEFANQIKIPSSCVSIHLRSGDIVYGRYRYDDRHTSKVVSFAQADYMMHRLAGHNVKVILFGQSDSVCRFLANKFSGLFFGDDKRVAGMSSLQRAIFDMVLMSRTCKIYAGNSGFSQLAELIGDANISVPEEDFNHESMAKHIIDILAQTECSDIDHYQRAFGCWHLVYHFKNVIGLEQAIYHVEKALEYTADCLFYRVVLATMYHEAQDFEKAGIELKIVLESKGQNTNGLGDYRYLSKFRYSDGRSPLHNYRDHLLQMSKSGIDGAEALFRATLQLMKLLTYISRVVRSIKSHLLMRNLNSNSFVDEEWYLKNYPDVAAAGVNPKVHYEIYGRKEGRLPFYLPSIPLERNLWANAFTPEKVLEELCAFVDDNDANSIYTRKVLAEFFLFQGKYEQSLSYARKAIAEIDQVAGLINESSLFLTAFEAAYRLGSKSVAAQLLSHHRWKESNAKLLACQMLSLKKSLPYLNRIYLKHRLLEINSANSENYLDNLYAKHARWLWSNAFYSKRYKPAHKVSVVVPLYNAEDTISNALKSLLSQTWPEIEIIVVDDCSTDTSLEVVSTFTKYPNVKVLTNSENMGAYPTRNRGAKQASGDFITVMDADDWAHPQKIELQVLPLISDQGFVGTVSHWVRCNESLEFTRLRNDGSWIYRNISSLMIPSKIFKTVGYWDELKAGADTEFYLRLLANFGENSIHEVLQDVPLSFGRVHSASLTQTSKTHLVTQFGGVRQEHLGYAKCWHKNSPLPIKLENQACHFPVPPELCSNALSRGLSEQEIHRWRRALDNSWYLERYSDVSKMGVTLYDHFWSSGEALDYAPSPLFVPSAYRYKKKLCSTVSPTWDALINGWNFSEPVVCDGASDTDGAHILIVAHSVSQELFGAELSFEDIVNAAHASGYKVTLVLPNAANTDYVTRLLKKSNRIIFLPLQWFTSSNAASSEIERFMTSYIQSNAVSLVYINTIMMNEPYRAANNVNVPVITHVRELPEHDNHIRGLLQETAEQTAERLKRWTDYFVANSHFTAEWLGLKDRVFVLSNQVEQPERVAPIDLAAPLKVCLIGSNIQKKGVEDFFCIAQACKATDIQFSLYGPVTHDVKCAEKKYPTKNIVYEGYTQNIQEAIQANDIVLSLSWFQESFGRTAAEAMSNGRVVLGYDYGAILETVSEHGGMFFPFKRPDLVADALKVIAKNKVMLLPLAKHALQKARLEYSQEIYHTKFKRIVDEILTSHSTKQR